MMNPVVSQNQRSFFDRPRMRESEIYDGLLNLSQQYSFNDRQASWQDEAGPLGEARRTHLDHLGPLGGVGGALHPQLPSYWRKIKNWQAFSVPELRPPKTLSPRRNPKMSELIDGSAQPRNLLEQLADTPAKEATAFWRGYAEAQESAARQRARNSLQQGR